MPDKKISQLTAAGALAGTELVPIDQSATTVATTAQDIANLAHPTLPINDSDARATFTLEHNGAEPGTWEQFVSNTAVAPPAGMGLQALLRGDPNGNGTIAEIVMEATGSDGVANSSVAFTEVITTPGTGAFGQVKSTAGTGTRQSVLLQDQNGLALFGQLDGANPGPRFDFPEALAAVPNPGVNTGRLFARDNGAGKTQLCVIFNTGAAIVLATQA